MFSGCMEMDQRDEWVNGAFPLAFWEAFDMILLPLKLSLAFLFGEVIRFLVVTSCKKAFSNNVSPIEQNHSRLPTGKA